MPRRAGRTLGGRSAHAPQRAVAGWPRLPRPAKTRTGWRNCEARERAKRLSLGSARLEQTATAAMGASGAHRNRAERRGRTAGARYGMGVQRKGRVRATCTETSTVQPAARGSVRCDGVLGMAWQQSRLDQLGCALDGGCQGARGCLPCDLYLEPASERVTVWSCFALRLLLACVTRPSATACGGGMHLGGHGLRERLRVKKRAGLSIGRWLGV